MYYMQNATRVLVVLALGAASWWSMTLAVADTRFRKQTPEDVASAVRLAPRNTGYLFADAIQTEYAGGDATSLLERVALLNPRSSAPRIRLGLAAEIRGDPATAERWLLDAANVDRQFETRWTLANFYFRQDRKNEFWTWIRPALEMSYGDRRLAFDLCGRMSEDDHEVFTRAIPERREVLGAYLAYLIDKRHMMSVAPVATKFATGHTRDDLSLLYAAVDVLIYTGDFQNATELWQALGYPRPSGVTNPDFATTPASHGFDWRIIEQPGVTHAALETPRGHRIRLNGQQPESVELLRQLVGGLNAGSSYKLHWESRTQGLPALTGLAWKIAGESLAIAGSETWSGGEVMFTADSDHVVLVLAYRRPAGEPRADGLLDLRGVKTNKVAAEMH